MKVNIMSIDAWRECEGGWTYNASYKIKSMEVEEADMTPRKVANMLRREGILSPASAGAIRVEVLPYERLFIEIQARGTHEPLIAIEECYHD
jgi:hypothetical protein